MHSRSSEPPTRSLSIGKGILGIVGRSQIGRLRYTAPDAALDGQVPFQSVDEVLKRRRDGDLFDYMMDRFATYSGIAGVQPKVMIRDEKAAAVLDGRTSLSVQGATHIVKFWDPNVYPYLAANEYFCLLAAEKAGLKVPRRRLSEDGAALVVDRFDLRADGTYMGIEDFCVLNGKGTEKKYEGGYETAVFKRVKDFVSAEAQHSELEKLFILFVLNSMVRNGDAHLKNFALTYDEVEGEARLADVYDIVTTTIYIPTDTMALTLDGTPKWPDLKQLTRLGTVRCGLSPKEVTMIMDRVGTAVSEARADLKAYANHDPSFAKAASAMAAQWEIGIRNSLGTDAR